MFIERLDHVSIRTADVARSVDFYARALGLAPGARPPFDFPGAWLYRTLADGTPTGTAIVHIIGSAAGPAGALAAYLGERPEQGPGTGAFDHVALAATAIGPVRARLEAAGIAFRERRVPVMNIRQIFVEDPDGVTIELNFPPEGPPA